MSNFAPDDDHNQQTAEIVRLTKELAAASVERLVELANLIPQVEHTADDLLAEEKPDGRKLNEKWNHSFVAKIGDQTAGFISGYIRDPDGTANYPETTLYISELAVDPQFQGGGIGRRLVEQFIRSAKEAEDTKYLPVTLQTNAAEDNKPVIDLYSSLGFVKVGEKPYDNRTDIVMRLVEDEKNS